MATMKKKTVIALEIPSLATRKFISKSDLKVNAMVDYILYCEDEQKKNAGMDIYGAYKENSDLKAFRKAFLTVFTEIAEKFVYNNERAALDAMIAKRKQQKLTLMDGAAATNNSIAG